MTTLKVHCSGGVLTDDVVDDIPKSAMGHRRYNELSHRFLRGEADHEVLGEGLNGKAESRALTLGPRLDADT